MADKDEFSFEVEENSPSGDSGISWMEQEEPSEVPKAVGQAGRKGSMTRILLLVLLLVAAGGAGFYYMAMMPEGVETPPPAPQVAIEKQPIAVPPRPAQEAPPAQKVVAVAEEARPQAEPAVESKPLPEKGTEVEQSAPEKSSSPPASVEAPEQVASAVGDYAVAAGAYVLRSNLAEAERRVQASGFVPQVVQETRKIEMTRLRIGIFSPQEGRTKVEEVAELAPDAFYLPAEGGVAVYAASFQNLDKARNFADRLYKQGLRVEEEYAKVDIPLYLLSFGGFGDLESAREAAERVRAAGLETAVVKKTSL